MAVLGGVSRRLSSEGTLSRCPEFARFTFGEVSRWSSTVWYGDSATGVGELVSIGGIAPSKP